MNKTWIEGNGITLANPRLRQGFIEAEEVKPLLELATEALFSKTALSSKLKKVDPGRNTQVQHENLNHKISAAFIELYFRNRQSI